MDLIEEGCAAQAKAMREFGYPDVTAETVKQYHADWKAGVRPKDVVAMFCNKAFEEHPNIFGESDAS